MADIKTAIRIDECLFRRLDRLAQKMRVSRNRLFAKAMQEFVDRRRNADLLERLNKAYQGHPDPEEQECLNRAKRRYAARIQAEDKW